MRCRLRDVELHWVEHGSGVPLVALHGAGVDHREVEAAFEAFVPETGVRRIYPDLPGMGDSTADGLSSNDDVVALLAAFVEHLDDGPVLLLGHSYGAYLARGVAAQRPELSAGSRWCARSPPRPATCPRRPSCSRTPTHTTSSTAAARADFDEYFVVRTAATARRYRDHVRPSTTTADEDAIGRIFSGWTIDVAGGFGGPTLVVAARHDSFVGYADAMQLLETYPRATLALVEDAGHALMHERPELLGPLIKDWVRRS